MAKRLTAPENVQKSLGKNSTPRRLRQPFVLKWVAWNRGQPLLLDTLEELTALPQTPYLVWRTELSGLSEGQGGNNRRRGKGMRSEREKGERLQHPVPANFLSANAACGHKSRLWIEIPEKFNFGGVNRNFKPVVQKIKSLCCNCSNGGG